MTPPPFDLFTGTVDTSWGPVTVSVGIRGVWRCDLPSPPGRLAGHPPVVSGVQTPPDSPVLLRDALAFARAVIEGRAVGKGPAVHPAVFAQATPFQQAIWRALRRIPCGSTETYTDVARQAGRPRAVRAAGGACGANPLPLFIPCHRVVAANGRLGGFSSGLGWKQWLLAVEGALPATRPDPFERRGAR